MPAQSRLLKWFKKNARPLPWRREKNWYAVFLSEIILQQTTVEQGLPYFQKIFKVYPTVEKLARADEQDILKLWAGLGYYARARNLLKAAGIIVARFGGLFPQTMADALQLPGIGPYSASAILSIAFNRAHAVVDGNILRVLARYYNNHADIRNPAVKKQFGKIAQDFLDRTNPGIFNEALMELGALICTPAHPDCVRCPLAAECRALKNDTVGQLPFKSPPAAKKKQYHIVIVLEYKGRYYIRQRPSKGLLGGMWEFPFTVTDQSGLRLENAVKIISEQNHRATRFSPIFRQLYSHIDLHLIAAQVPVCDPIGPYGPNTPSGKWVAPDDFSDFPIHNAHKKIIHWLKSIDQHKN